MPREDIFPITSEVKHTHKLRDCTIEAWQYKGEPMAEWPDWVRNWADERGHVDHLIYRFWAIRDPDAKFIRWRSNDQFTAEYEGINNGP